MSADYADAKGYDAETCGDGDEQAFLPDWLTCPEGERQRRGVERSVQCEERVQITRGVRPGHDGQQDAETEEQ